MFLKMFFFYLQINVFNIYGHSQVVTTWTGDCLQTNNQHQG